MFKPQRRNRKTAILTSQGLQRIQTAVSKTDNGHSLTRSCTLEALSDRTGLSTHTLSKVHARRLGVDLRSLTRYFTAFDLLLEASDYTYVAPTYKKVDAVPALLPDAVIVSEAALIKQAVVDWGVAPDVSVFQGRATELDTLQQWILEERCRLVTILGTGGIGKTWLATRLAEQIQHQFKVVIWRSLRPVSRSYPPLPFDSFVDDLIRHLTPQPVPATSQPIAAKIQQLMNGLRYTPCLLVLDNIEFVLPGYPLLEASREHSAEFYAADAEAYSYFLKYLGQGRHQSCVVLTSRVKPKPLRMVVGNTSGIQSLSLQGLAVTEVQQLFGTKSSFQGTAAEWNYLVEYYGGNPLFLGMVAEIIQQLFDGSLTEFMNQKTLMFDGIFDLLDQQFDCLSTVEQDVMRALANQNNLTSFSDLQSRTLVSIPNLTVLETLKSFEARSLIDNKATHFSLQPLLRDYLRERTSGRFKEVNSFR